MSYMLLIIEPLGQRATRTDAEGRALYDKMVAFGQSLQARGLLAGVQSLATASTRVQVRAGKPITRDGPFAESKEMVGGFFLLNCDSRAQALAIATECPAAEWATVEVREFGPCFL